MAPYRHFAGKDELLAAVAEQGFRTLSAALDAAAGRTIEGRAVMEIGVAYVHFACENPSLYQLMFGAKIEHCDRFPGLTAAGEEAFARCIAVARADGFDCATCAAPPAAVAMWSLVHGLSSLAIDGRVPLPEDPMLRRDVIVRIIASAFAGPAGAGA
jgi:AcrR family transcriptional regulator